MLDLLITRATLPDGRTNMSVAIQDGRIVDVAEGLNVPAFETVDAAGQLLSPPFCDPHFHMDACLSYGLPRVNQSGTLLEGIALWGELKPLLTAEALIERALTYCDWAVAKGLLAIRSHVDTSDPSLLPVQALLEVKRRVAPYLDLQLVAFPQDGVLRNKGGLDNLKRALALGVDVVGGIPHFERTMSEGAASVRLLCELAAEQGKLVDMHCDESDDPLSRHIETLAFETQRLGLQGRVNGSHLTSMHSMDNYYVSKLIPLIAEAGVSAVANPLINITLQGRHDSYPKRRGMTRVPELLAAGVTVAFGHDCVMDPWYSLGSGDMLEVAHMGLHVAQMTSQQGMRDCFSRRHHPGGKGHAPARLRPGARQRRELCAAAGQGPYRGHPPEGEPAEGLAQRKTAGRNGQGDDPAAAGRAPDIHRLTTRRRVHLGFSDPAAARGFARG
jgi:cytosine deaminase